MKGYLPTESDLKFQYNGWNCAFGYSGDGQDIDLMLLVKEKTKGTNPTASSGWESILTEDFFIQMAEKNGQTAEQALEEFRVRANAKLKERLGNPDGSGSGGIPPIPSDLFQRVLWLIRYGMDFRPETGEIVFK
jgi:hypothetical protein